MERQVFGQVVAFAESRSEKIATMTEMTKVFHEKFGEFSEYPRCKEPFISYRLEEIFQLMFGPCSHMSLY